MPDAFVSSGRAQAGARVVWATLLVIALWAPRAAAQPDIEATFVDRSPVEVDPGQPVSRSIRIANRGDRPVTVVDRFGVPEGWRLLGGEPPVTLAPGGLAVRLPAFIVDRNAAIRAYAVPYDVLDASSGAVLASDTLRVQITARYGVEIEREATPAYTVAGEPFAPSLLVTNTGNVRSRVVVDYTFSGPGAPATSADTVLVLGPAETRRLELAARTLDSESPATVRLTATARVDEPGAEGTERARTTTTVLPRRDGATLTYARYRAQAGLAAGIVGNGFRQESRLGIQGYASGAGRLGPESETTMTFDVQTPFFPRDDEQLRFEDVYRLSLENPSYSFLGGDVAVRQSLLANVFGFGASGTLRPGGEEAPLSVGAFYLDRRYDPLDDRSFGAEADLLALPGTRLGVNYLHKNGLIGGDYGSVAAGVEPVAGVEVEGELGYSENSVGRAGASGGARVAVRQRRVRFDGSVLEFGDAYPTLEANRRVATAFASADATRGLRISAGAFRTEIGSPFGGPRDRLSESYRVAADIARRLALQYRTVRREVQLPDRRVSTELDEAEARLRGRVGRLSTQVRGRVGTSRSSEFEDPAALYGGGLSASLSDGPWTVSANVDYTRGEALTGASAPVESLSGQATVGVRPAEGSRVRVAAFGTRFNSGDVESTFYVLQGEAEQRLPWGHLLGLDASYSVTDFSSVGEDSFARVLARYTVPFTVRTGRLRDTGLLRGIVVRQSTGTPLSDTPVFVERDGRSIAGAVTNGAGEFFFPELLPGAYTLFADLRGAGQQAVLIGGDAAAVEVTGGEMTDARLQVVESSGIRVATVIIDERDDDDTVYVDSSGEGMQVVANAPLVLENGDNELQTFTDGVGEAFFGRLRPGTYTLRMAGRGGSVEPVPGDSVVVTVGEGEVVEVTLRAQRAKRRVRFLNEAPVELGIGRAPAPDGPTDDGPIRHVVQNAESLSTIARRYYGETDCWQVIADANQEALDEPEALLPGFVLTIPRSATTAGVTCERTDGPARHVVREGESLSSLARRYYGVTECWQAIARANIDRLPAPDLLEPGDELVIPAVSTLRGSTCVLRRGGAIE